MCGASQKGLSKSPLSFYKKKKTPTGLLSSPLPYREQRVLRRPRIAVHFVADVEDHRPILAGQVLGGHLVDALVERRARIAEQAHLEQGRHGEDVEVARTTEGDKGTPQRRRRGRRHHEGATAVTVTTMTTGDCGPIDHTDQFGALSKPASSPMKHFAAHDDSLSIIT